MTTTKEADYTSKTYWNERFVAEEEYEWVADFAACSKLILPELKSTDRILHVGCGNSKLSQQLVDAGYPNITNVDFSDVLVAKGATEHPEQAWICDDMRTLSRVPDGSFDVVIEKASIESLLTKEKSVWTLSPSGQADLDATLSAISRVLVPGGLFISISFTPPYFRVNHLVRHSWSVRVDAFGDAFHFYCYRMRKGEVPDLQALESYLRVTRGE